MAKSVYREDIMKDRDVNEEIAKTAYELYQKRGMGDGYDIDDWLKAERIVRERSEKTKKHEINVMPDMAKKIATQRRTNKQAARETSKK